jgi:metallo-beta-lactamase family protein
MPLPPALKFQFTDAGHVLGSAAVHITVLEDGKETQITFSGDVGRYGDLLLKNPQTFPQADYILLESTYGDLYIKILAQLRMPYWKLLNKPCEIKKGKVIIPAFSVGRTQELLYALNALELRGCCLMFLTM